MCGICGIYNAQSLAPVLDASLQRMTRLLEHRGPDDEGFYLNHEIALGFRRLRIIDLPGSRQPLTNETGDLWLVFNGEIWNYQSLRVDLQVLGHRFRSQGDGETILHAYEEYGSACLEHLHGMFAFAIWDSRSHSLFLARDRAGKKPLYYTVVDGDFLFASEIKALLCDSRVSRQVDLQSLADLLSIRYVPAPATLFQNIFKVQPGHWLLYKDRRVREVCYWDFSFSPLEKRQPNTISTYIQGIRKHVSRAVEERMLSDVPVGTLLSGGVDSSVITGHMARLSSQPVQTFAVGFDVQGFSELSYARQVAEHFATTHHELIVTAKDLTCYWPRLTWHRDEPVSEPSDLGIYLIAHLARKHVGVVLSGEGGDELFAGYPKYALDGLARYYQLLPTPLRQNLLSRFWEQLPYQMRKVQTAMRALGDVAPQRWINWFGTFRDPLKERLLARSLQTQVDMNAARLFQHWLRQSSQRDALSSMLYLDTKIWLPDNLLMKSDKMCMACSLECRLPLLDEHLITYAASIPSHLKVYHGQTKYIFKQSFTDLLPHSILTRKKMGFNVPTGTWFRREQRLFLSNLLLSERMHARGLYNRPFVEQMLQDHLHGRKNYQAQLFALASLEIWFRVFIDPSDLSLPPYTGEQEQTLSATL